MIYVKNNTETQTIYIPRNELQKEAYNATIKTYEDGYKDGFGEGKQYQKDQLLNLYVTENGQYVREDGWGTVTVDIPIGECPEGGSCNLGEGDIYLTANDAGFYELDASDDGYDGWSKFYVTLENGGAIKVHKASDLLDTFNNGEQIDFGAYYYVGGKITDIQEISMEWGNATYTLDNGFSVYRGKWFDGNPFSDENQIKVGAYIVVYGIIQNNNGKLRLKSGSQVIAYQECEGGEIVSCNLGYKDVTITNNGTTYLRANEDGLDGYDLVSINVDVPTEGGSCSLGEEWITLGQESAGAKYELYASDNGYDGYSKVTIEVENFTADCPMSEIWTAYILSNRIVNDNISGGEEYVRGTITSIQEVSTQYGNATYVIDDVFKVYRGKWFNGEPFYDGNEIQVGDWVIVRGTTQNYNGQAQFKAGSQVVEHKRCEGGSGNCDDAYNSGYNDGYGNGFNDGQANCEGGSCNLEDKWVTPSMGDRDDNGYVVTYPSEGFDGLSRVVIDPTIIYNEGYSDGYNEGSNQLSNNVLEGDMVLSFQLNDNNFPDLRNDGKGIFMWDGFKVPLYIKRPNGCGELYLSGNYDKNIAPSLQSKFFQDDDYAKIEKLTINFWYIQPDNIVNVVNLKELHLTERVEIISNNAFQDVNNLKTIYCYYDGGAYMSVTKDSFVGLPNNGTLYVKKSQKPSWGWIEDLGWTIVNI